MPPETSLAAVGTGLLPTGVPNLDLILGGGFFAGATVILIGAPGTGKTIMAQQICFNAARRGANTFYFTGYSESHDKLILHNPGLAYFDAGLVGDKIVFSSLMDLLEQGAAVAEEAIVATVTSRRAELVVLDGFGSMRRLLPGEQGVAQFVYSLGAKLALLGTTMIV